MSTFPKYFKHADVGTRYQVLIVMNEESAPGVILEFQHEIYDYRPAELQPDTLALFQYQPDVLVSVNTSVLPALVQLRADPNWIEGKMQWEMTNVIGVEADSGPSTPTGVAETVEDAPAVAVAREEARLATLRRWDEETRRGLQEIYDNRNVDLDEVVKGWEPETNDLDLLPEEDEDRDPVPPEIDWDKAVQWK